MDLKKIVLKEHSKVNTLKIVKYIGNDPVRFRELVELFIKGPYRITQRTAWPLSYCVANHPKLIRPHLARVLTLLGKPGVHDAVKRNIVRLLQFVEIPKSLRGKVASRCFDLMASTETIAVRVFSMTVLAQIAREEPDLKRELLLVIEDQLPYASAGYLSRARKVLRELKK